jgi:hypothetical protein
VDEVRRGPLVPLSKPPAVVPDARPVPIAPSSSLGADTLLDSDPDRIRTATGVMIDFARRPMNANARRWAG